MRLSAPTRNHAEIVQAVVASSNAGARSGFAASWRRSMIHHKLDPARARVSRYSGR